AGLLGHRATCVEDRGLARDLEAHRTLDRAEGVDVLRLGACPEGRVGSWPQRDVDVGPDVTALHARLGDLERAEDVAQGLDVGARDLGRPLPRARDRSRDDLDERDARAVVVDVRVLSSLDPTRGPALVRVISRYLLDV